MNRIKINATFEEDEEERRQFFLGLSYSERLKYYIKTSNILKFHPQSNRQDFRFSAWPFPQAPNCTLFY